MKKNRFVVGFALGTGILSLALLKRYQRVRDESLAWQKKRCTSLDVFACPECHGELVTFPVLNGEAYFCSTCQKEYPVVAGIPHFVQPKKLTGANRQFAAMYNWFSWGYRAFSTIAFAYIGMSEEQARREITDRLEPKAGRVLEVSIGPGVNLPYLVGRSDVGEIYGLDLSLGQLNRCKEFVARLGWNVQLQLGNAEQLPYQDNTFESVFHIGGINFFNDKEKAIKEMIRVARPGTRILICDENEKGARAYERFLPGFKKLAGGARPAIDPPLSLIPPEMEETRLFDVWKGWMYCIEFRKPISLRQHDDERF
jgi:ubiquinone/menaquinone biosynthesis C-methylase UbiE